MAAKPQEEGGRERKRREGVFFRGERERGKEMTG